ncbi:hypothetical protein C8J56DRAFT_1045398 [Mycena floridula]|nr:hypothetical protein C8J56DRAFT_1045398 [Mycena floridula]
MDVLPQELVEQCLDFLDIATLKNSSLVCRAWLVRARFHIFSTVQLNLDQQERAPRFLELLVSQNCTFSESIQHLELCEKPNPQHYWVRKRRPPSTFLLEDLMTDSNLHKLVSRAHFLKSIQSLTLTGVGWDMENSAVLTFYQAFHSVGDLFLNNMWFDDVAQLMDIAHSLPFLKKLGLGSLNFASTSDGKKSFQRGPKTPRWANRLNLEVLVVTSVPPEVYEWFCKKESYLQFHSVSISFVKTAELGVIRRFLVQFGPSIEHLEVSHVDEYSSGSEFPPPAATVTFARLGNLRSVHFIDISLEYVPGTYRKSIPKLLSELPSAARIEEVYIVCRFFAEGKSWIRNFLEWGRLEEALELQKFAALGRLTFVCPMSHVVEVKKVVAKYLPRLQRRGIVAVIGQDS